MNKEVKALWIAALESGEYQQVQGSLRQEDAEGEVGYCCLGVLCDIAAKNGVEMTFETRNWGGEKGYSYYDSLKDFLPAVVQEWAGLDTGDGRLDEEVYFGDEFLEDGHLIRRSVSTLAELNDEAGFNFIEIKAVIDQQF